MNFRELFSKLDSIETVSERVTFDANGNAIGMFDQKIPQAPKQSAGITARPAGLQPVQNLDGSARPGAAEANAVASTPEFASKPNSKPDTAPGAQPNLAPKPTIQAQQFPNQTPAAPGVAPTDPKSDVNAMARALQAVVGKTNQPQLQPTTSASVQQQAQAATASPDVQDTPKTATGAKPGEPMEEENNSIFRRKKQPEVKDNTEDAIKYYARLYGKDNKTVIPAELRDRVIAQSQAENPVAAAQEQPAKDPNAPAKPAADASKPAADASKPAKEPAKADGKEDGKEPAKADGKEDGKEPAKAADAEPAKKKAWGKGVLGKGVGMSGAINPEVQALQQKLIAADDKYKALLGDEGADGRYGEKTKQAVMQFQKDWNEKYPDKKIAVDGAAGGQTRPLIGNLPSAEVKPTEVKPTEVKPTEVKPTAVDAVKSDKDKLADIEKAAAEEKALRQRVADADFRDKYTGVDPSTLIRQTGNMQKNRFDLKAGDVDYDARGVKHVWKPDPMGGPGTWQASYDKFSDWKAEPGLGVVGNSASSEAGQKYVADRQARILNPQQAADYDRIFAKPAAEPTPVTAPASKEIPGTNTNVSLATKAVVGPNDAHPELTAVPAPSAEKIKNEQLSKQLEDLANELLGEETTKPKWFN